MGTKAVFDPPPRGGVGALLLSGFSAEYISRLFAKAIDAT